VSLLKRKHLPCVSSADSWRRAFAIVPRSGVKVPEEGVGDESQRRRLIGDQGHDNRALGPAGARPTTTSPPRRRPAPRPATTTKSIAHHRHSHHRTHRQRQTAAQSCLKLKTSLKELAMTCGAAQPGIRQSVAPVTGLCPHGLPVRIVRRLLREKRREFSHDVVERLRAPMHATEDHRSLDR
jgi:hypothetical protein